MQTQTKRRARVLVVEDELLLALNLEQLISDFGMEVVGPFATLAGATRAAETEQLDGALLDIRLHDGEGVYPVADILLWRGIPHMFVTAQSREDIESAYVGTRRLSKPLHREDLRAALHRLLTRQ
jgi:DNA-binding response OmpR family regulator